MKKPNIVLIVADQIRADILGCYGSAHCKTPNLDALAYSGTTFDNAYTVVPVCSPARASMLTGLYPHNHGVLVNTHIGPRTTRGLSQDLPTFGPALIKAGYRTHYLGKWHVNEDISPTGFGFDTYQPDVSWWQFRNSLGNKRHLKFINGEQLFYGVLEDVPEEEMNASLLSKAAIKVLNENKDSDQPFFLRVDFMQPHFPNIVPKRFVDMYRDFDPPQWPNYDDDYSDKPAVHLRKHEEWALADKDWGWWKDIIRMYYADVSYLDHCCGQIINYIKSEKTLENTLILFTADHGDPTGTHKHMEKGGTMFDEVTRIPMIAAWAGNIIPGGRIPFFVRNMDICPTIMAVANVEDIWEMDAMDMSGLWRGEKNSAYDSVYCEYHGDVWGLYTQRMVRTLDYKYVFNPYDIDELYDLSKDCYEIKNLARLPEYKDKLNEMKARLAGWIVKTDDVLTYSFVRRNLPDAVAPCLV